MAYAVTRMLVEITRSMLVLHLQMLVIVSFGIKAGKMELFVTEIARVVLTPDVPQSPSTVA